jgi:hypothetical protein
MSAGSEAAGRDGRNPCTSRHSPCLPGLLQASGALSQHAMWLFRDTSAARGPPRRLWPTSNSGRLQR